MNERNWTAEHNSPRSVTHSEYPITAVTGYWDVKGKHSGRDFDDWFNHSLMINAPYIVFGVEETLTRFKKIRDNFPTACYVKDITDFSTATTIDLNKQNTHPLHCPSVNLGRIWLEKMNLVSEASKLNVYQTEWFAWIDSGFSYFRERMPPKDSWPSADKLSLLSKRKINYSESQPYDASIRYWSYTHCVSAGAFIIHISMIEEIRSLFYHYLQKCIDQTDEYTCLSEQCIFTRMLSDYPNLFNRIAKGYGMAVVALY